MTGHDIICLHTMVGTLAGTNSMFHDNGYGGTESHLGVGENKTQGVKQWQDGMYQADANLDGNPRVFSVETADWGGVFGKWDDSGKSGDQVPAWTEDQLDMIVDIVAWFCRKETHANCPSSWKCHQEGVPALLIPDTKPGRRGIGYHAQGIVPNLVAGGIKWSSHAGKICPGKKRIWQLINIVIPKVQAKISRPAVPTDTTPEEEDAMAALTKEDIKDAVAAAMQDKLSLFVTGDNNHDSQVLCWQTAAQSWSDLRMKELKDKGVSAADAITQVKDELWPILRPLWS
jgi:hypothetical protein